MPLSPSQTKTGAALIAAILASAGGYQFLKHNPNATLRDVYTACEQGKLDGIVCCEDVTKINFANAISLAKKPSLLTDDEKKQCGAVRPGFHDPLGFRVKEENDWDSQVAKEMKK